MKKEEILQRLKATLDNLKALEDEKFTYCTFTRGFNEEHNCPTSACVAGWYPLWFPSLSLVWEYRNDSDKWELIESSYQSSSPDDISETLCRYHGLNGSVIDILFFGATGRSPMWTRTLNPEERVQMRGVFEEEPICKAAMKLMEDKDYTMGFDKIFLELHFTMDRNRVEVIKIWEFVIYLIENDLIQYQHEEG